MGLRDDFYILEALRDDDIRDGQIFRDSLRSIEGFQPEYIRIENYNDFESGIRKYAQDDYKYLLISAHGNEEHIDLNGKVVNVDDLYDIDVRFDKKRVFMSSCKGGSLMLAKYFIRKGAYSVIGTPDDLDQIVAVAMWPTILLLFERYGDFDVRFNDLDKAIRKVVEIYRIPINYYSFIRRGNKMKEYKYNYGKKRVRNDHEV